MDKSFRNRTEVVVNRRIYDAMDGSVRKKKLISSKIGKKYPKSNRCVYTKTN